MGSGLCSAKSTAVPTAMSNLNGAKTTAHINTYTVVGQQREAEVPQSDILNPQRASIDHASCPKCGSAMWLARIEPDKPDHDTHFPGLNCEHTETKVVNLNSARYRQMALKG